MSFIHSIVRWLKESGAPEVKYQLLAQSANTAITLPATGTFWPGNPRAGYVRIKQNSLTTSDTVKMGVINATDGTNIANVYQGDDHYTSAGTYIDRSFFFNYDWEVSKLNLNVWTGLGGSTFDIEVVGTR
jgi:hypothetical protein